MAFSQSQSARSAFASLGSDHACRLPVFADVLMNNSFQSQDAALPLFSARSPLLEEQESLPITDLERFLISKWKRASHFQPYHSPESVSLVLDMIHGQHGSILCDETAAPVAHPAFDMPLSLSTATCAAVSASPSNAHDILKAATKLIFQAQSCLGSVDVGSVHRMFDADTSIQISCLGHQLLLLPSFGLSTADCTTAALQLAIYFENFPLLCKVVSHVAKLTETGGSSIAKTICESGAHLYQEVSQPLNCNITDLSQGPSFSLPLHCDSIFDCVFAMLSCKMHCLIHAIRGGQHVIIDYTLPDAALSSSDCDPTDSDSALQPSPVAGASSPLLKGSLRASGIETILQQGNSPFARTGFSDQVVAMISEGVASEELSSFLTEFLGDENVVAVLIQWVQASLPQSSAPKSSIPQWRRNLSGFLGTEVAAVFDGPPTIINYLGTILIVDSRCVRSFDGLSLKAEPSFTWITESQRQLASILHHGSHCVVGRIVFVTSEALDQSCTLIQAFDPSNDWNMLLTYRVKIAFFHGLTHHLGCLMIQQTNDGSSITYVSVPLSALTSTRFQEDLALAHVSKCSIRCQASPSGRIRYSDDKHSYTFHTEVLDDSLKSCAVSFLVDAFSHNQFDFDWLPPINKQVYQLSDFVSRATPLHGNSSHEGICTYNGWALTRSRHPEIKDTTVILDLPVSAMNRERYFEVVIHQSSENDGISVGLCHPGYDPLRSHPGWYPSSVAYHGDDGRFYVGDPDRKQFGASVFVKKGDVAGCGILDHELVFFTRNGMLVGVFHVPGSSIMHPAFGGRKDDSADSGNECSVRVAPPFSFELANAWPQFARNQSIIERSWPTQLVTPIPHITVNSSAWELCSHLLSNLSRSAQIEFESIRIGAHRCAEVFSYHSLHWKFVHHAVATVSSSSHQVPSRGDRRSRSNRQERRSARNEADRVIEPPVPASLADAQPLHTALPKVLKIHCQGCTHVELFICPSSFIGSVAFRLSQDASGNIPLGIPCGYASPGPVPGLCGFPSIVIACSCFYVHFSEPKDGSFYSFSVVALPLMAAGSVRINDVKNLLVFLSLFDLSYAGRLSGHHNLWDSAINILRVQAQCGWLQLIISEEATNSPAIQSLIRILTMVLSSGSLNAQFMAAGLFLHCLSVSSFSSSLTEPHIVDTVIQICRLGLETECAVTSFLETGFVSFAYNFAFWNHLFQNASNEIIEKMVSIFLSLALWHKRHNISETLSRSFHGICKTFLLLIFRGCTSDASLRLHVIQILCDAALAWSSIEGQSLISESFLSCAVIPVFLIFDVETVSDIFASSLIDFLTNISAVINNLPSDIQIQPLRSVLMTVFNLGLSAVIRSAESCLLSSQPSESNTLADLMNSSLFSSGFISSSGQDAAAEVKRAILLNDDSIRHIFELLNGSSDFKTDFSKIEHRTSAFLFLSASGFFPFFQGYDEQSPKSRESFQSLLHSQWQEYSSCTKDCWSDSVVMDRAKICLDLQSLNSWSSSYHLEYSSPFAVENKSSENESTLVAQLLNFIKSDVSPSNVTDCIANRRRLVNMRLQGLHILKTFVESFGKLPSSCDTLTMVSHALLKFMSNDKTTSNFSGDLHRHQELNVAYSAFMTCFSNACIKCSTSHISRASIMYLTKLLPNDEIWVASQSFQRFLQLLIAINSPHIPIENSGSHRQLGINIPHLYSACYLPSGHWICHGGVACVDSVLSVSSQFWMRDIGGHWHLLDISGQVSQIELSLTGHTLTTLPNGTIVIIGGLSNPPVDFMRKVIFADVDIDKKSVVVRHVDVNYKASSAAIQPMDHSVVYNPSNNSLIVVGGRSTKSKPLSQCLSVSFDLSNTESPSATCKFLPEPDRSVCSSPLGRKPALCLSQAIPSKLFVFHGDCHSPAILELDFRSSDSEAWKSCCNVQPAGIGRSLFIDNRDCWVLYGGYGVSDEVPLDTIRVSSTNFSISHVESTQPVFMRHFVSSSCVLGCSHQDFYQVIDGGSNIRCQQLHDPKLFEFNPNSLVKTSAETQDVSRSNIKTLLKVFALQSVGPGSIIPKSLFSSIWTHYANSFFQISKHLSIQKMPLYSSGVVLIENYFNLDHWNGTIASDSGHVTLGSWCWISSSSLSKPVTLFSLSRNRTECCIVRLCESRHVEVISTTSQNTTKVISRSDHPVPISQWLHVAVSVKCSAVFQCRLFLGGHPTGRWSKPSSLISGTSRNSDDGKYFENASFAVCIPPCNIIDIDSIILCNFVAIDSVNHRFFSEWSLHSPPAWDKTQLMIRHCKDIVSVLRSGGTFSSSIVIETPGFLSSMVLSLLYGPKQVSVDCALYFSEVSGSFSIAELDAALLECRIEESCFVSAVLSRIHHLLRLCLSRAVSLMNVLHLMLKNKPDSENIVFQAIKPLLRTEIIVLPLSDEVCADICVALAIISGDFQAIVPGAAVQLGSCHGILKSKSADDIHVLHIDHDEYIISTFPIASIGRDCVELTVKEDVFLPVCEFCHFIMALCNDFRKSTGVDLSLEIASNAAIRTICSLNTASCNSPASQEMNSHLMHHLLRFSQDFNGMHDISSDLDIFLICDYVKKLKRIGMQPMNPRAITNQSVSHDSLPLLFEPFIGPYALDTRREPGRTFLFETQSVGACSVTVGFVAERTLNEMFQDSCWDVCTFPFSVSMTRASFPNASGREVKISKEACSSGVMWASFQIDMNHFLVGLLTHGRQPDIRHNGDRSPRFIGSEVPAEAVAGSRLPPLTSADICTVVLDFNSHSLSFYQNLELALSLPVGAGPYHVIFQGFMVTSCIKPIDSESDIIQAVLKLHRDNSPSPWPVGTKVSLSSHRDMVEVTKSGPMKTGEIGVVRQFLENGSYLGSYLVESACGQQHIYPRQALVKDYLPNCWFTSIDLPVPNPSTSNLCSVSAAWCESSAFKFEAHIDGRPISLAPLSVPPREMQSDVWWPFALIKCGSPNVSFLSKVASDRSERMSSCELIFHRRLIRRKRYREHAAALAKRLSTWAQGNAERASQLVSDHRKFREVTEAEFWTLLHPSKRDRAPWLKELFEFGVRTRVAWKACERQSDVQAAGVWATDERNANSFPADSQSEDDEPAAGPTSSSLLPRTISVSKGSFVAQLESLKGDHRSSILSSQLFSQGETDELTTLRYEDPYVVLDDSGAVLNASKSRLAIAGVLQAGNVDIMLLEISDSIMAASASHALKAIVKIMRHIDLNDSQHSFSSFCSADLVSFLFNFISSDTMPIQFASQIGGLLDSVIAKFGIVEIQQFFCLRVVKDVRSCSRCLQFMKVTTSLWHKYDILNSPSCIESLTDALLAFSSPHIRVSILRLFGLCASKFVESAACFRKFFRILSAGYTYMGYSSHLDVSSAAVHLDSLGPHDQHSSMLSAHAAVKSLSATPAVQSALFEFIFQAMLLPNGRDLVSPMIYDSIPATFIRTVWSMACCRPLALCSFVPEISSTLEAFEILSLSEVVSLSATGSCVTLPAFSGASGIRINLPAVYGSFSVHWPDGRSLKFLSSPGYHPPLQIASAKPSEPAKKPQCRNWAANGSCKYSKCRFDHSPSSDSAVVIATTPHTPQPPSSSPQPSSFGVVGGGGAVSHECRQSVSESIATFESKLRAREGKSPSAESPSKKDKVAPLSEIVLEDQPNSIVFHHEAFGVSVSPIYIPCFDSVQDLACKDPSSEDVTLCALGLCTRHGMFDQAVKVLDLIASADRIPSLAEHSLAIASCNADCIDKAFSVMKHMESCGQTASCEVVQVLADCCAAAGQFALAKSLHSKYKGKDATNFFGADMREFSKRVWPLVLDCIAVKGFNLYFDADSSCISNLLVQFLNFLPSSTTRPIVQQSIAAASQQGGRFEASLSRFKASKAKCKGNSDDGNTVFSQLMDIVAQKGIRTFRSPFMEAPFEVKFKGEDGRDRIDRQGGGLFRECCSLLCSELQSAALPILMKLPDRGAHASFVFRSSLSATHRGQRLLQFLGSLIGMVLHCGEPLNLDLDASVWIAILGLSQRALYSSASDRMHPAVKDRHERIEGLRQLMLCGEAVFDETVALGGDWEFCVQSLEGELIDLVPQGRFKTVTFKSCVQLISSLESFVENEMRDCMRHVQQGLCRVVPMSSLLLLSWEQLEEMVCGQREVSWEALRSCLRCGSGYNSMRDLPVQLLCESLSSFSSQQRSMFLRFVSGRSRLPRAQPSSASEQCIHIIKSDVPSQSSPDSYLPKAHTCFFQLELPAYSSAEVCRQRLLYAICNCQEVDGEHQQAARAEDLAEFQ